VTSRKDQHQYWANKGEPYSYVSVQEFVDAFQSFHVGRKQGQELKDPFRQKKEPPRRPTTFLSMVLFTSSDLCWFTCHCSPLFNSRLDRNALTGTVPSNLNNLTSLNEL
ncbi:hypothetical protein IFM89_031182, partial [Coptis chinensis]